jgi:dTDP-4-dehydrorhamnose reductase
MLNSNSYNVLVTGSSGQVGSEIRELSEYYSYNFFFLSKNELDITNFDMLKEFIIKNNINVIINCAAYTAVDKAEKEIELADRINHLGVKNLSKLSYEFTIKLIQLSTDYVFDGEKHKAYTENDITNPLSVYGKTNYEAEQEMFNYKLKNCIIIRTSWIHSVYGNNFVKTMLKLAKEKNEINVVIDQIGTPTYGKDLARIILEIIPNINNDKVEIFNYSNEGVTSWYDFAKEIMKMAKLNCKINPIETYQYPTPAKRPHFSLLNKNKIKSTFNIEIPYWKDGLDDCLRRLGERR